MKYRLITYTKTKIFEFKITINNSWSDGINYVKVIPNTNPPRTYLEIQDIGGAIQDFKNFGQLRFEHAFGCNQDTLDILLDGLNKAVVHWMLYTN